MSQKHIGHILVQVLAVVFAIGLSRGISMLVTVEEATNAAPNGTIEVLNRNCVSGHEDEEEEPKWCQSSSATFRVFTFLMPSRGGRRSLEGREER
jgi:hypothetical protein